MVGLKQECTGRPGRITGSQTSEEPLTSADSPELASWGQAGRAPTHQERGVAGDSDPIDQGLLLQQTKGAPRWRVQPQRLFEDLQTPHGEITRDVRRPHGKCQKHVPDASLLHFTVLNVHPRPNWVPDPCKVSLICVSNPSCDRRRNQGPEEGLCKATVPETRPDQRPEAGLPLNQGSHHPRTPAARGRPPPLLCWGLEVGSAEPGPQLGSLMLVEPRPNWALLTGLVSILESPGKP